MPNATESFAGSCDWLALVRAGAAASSRAAEAVCKYRLPLAATLRATGARESEPSVLCA